MTDQVKGEKTMTNHKTGTREEWLAARLELLKAEKELTRRSDELARKRQELPWVRIESSHSRNVGGRSGGSGEAARRMTATSENPGTPCRARWCCGATAQGAQPTPQPRSRA